jgi:hypothetical protein
VTFLSTDKASPNSLTNSGPKTFSSTLVLNLRLSSLISRLLFREKQKSYIYLEVAKVF